MSEGASVPAFTKHASAASKYSAARNSLPISPYASASADEEAPVSLIVFVSDSWRSRRRDCTSGEALAMSGKATGRNEGRLLVVDA